MPTGRWEAENKLREEAHWSASVANKAVNMTQTKWKADTATED